MITSIYPQPHTLAKSSQKNQIRFPEDIQVILRADRPHIGNLFLSNIEAAQNSQILQNLQITSVVTAAKGQRLKHGKDVIKQCKYVPLDDDQRCQIYDFLDETVTFIADQLKKTNVLVHCVAGVSRSAALVIAFLMRERRLNLEDAYNQAKSRRRTICPSQNILEQLQMYEQQLSNKPNKNKSIPQQQSIRNDTVSNRSNMSFLKPKTNRDDMRSNRQNQSKLFTQMEDIKSQRSYRSQRTNRSNLGNINIEILEPKENVRNPEESFALDKSFASSRPRSCREKSQMEQDYILESPTKKLSESRQDFSKKMTKYDSKNNKINQKYNLIQDRYQTETKTHKQTLDSELNQIYKTKAKLYADYNQRKSKLTSKRSVHQSTMEDKDVKDYILSNMVATDPL